MYHPTLLLPFLLPLAITAQNLHNRQGPVPTTTSPPAIDPASSSAYNAFNQFLYTQSAIPPATVSHEIKSYFSALQAGQSAPAFPSNILSALPSDLQKDAENLLQHDYNLESHGGDAVSQISGPLSTLAAALSSLNATATAAPGLNTTGASNGTAVGSVTLTTSTISAVSTGANVTAITTPPAPSPSKSWASRDGSGLRVLLAGAAVGVCGVMVLL